jgi:hypothetical protein
MEPMDEYLGKRMQNWAARYGPPANGKARLLRNAAQAAYLRSHKTVRSVPEEHVLFRLFSSFNRKRYREDTNKFFDWTIVYSFEMSLVNLRLMF